MRALHLRGLCFVHELLDDEAEIAPRIMREKVVDGLIINYAFEAPPPVQDLLDRCQIPAIWVNCKRDYNCVRPADEGAAFEATAHLIGHGHADIAYVGIRRTPTGIYRDHYSQQDREGGYLRAMRQAGLSPRVEYLQAPEDPVEMASDWLVRESVEYLRRPNRPSAMLCYLDGRTMLFAAALASLRVPQDLSLIAFDRNTQTDGLPKTDRMLVPYWSMGRIAVAELCELIKHPGTRRESKIVPFGFVQANTVARPETRR